MRAGRAKRSNRLVFQLASVAAVIMASSLTGCNAISNLHESFVYEQSWNESANKMRAKSMSSRSWHTHKNAFCKEAYLHDFAAGYRAGYEDVANGSNGCTPAFPPRHYWSWQYQSAEGQKKVAAWFSGYPHGARAAEEEGVGHWSQIQMSSTMQSQYVTAGVFPNQGHACYPITEGSQPAALGGPTPVGSAVPLGEEVIPSVPGQPGAAGLGGAESPLPSGSRIPAPVVPAR